MKESNLVLFHRPVEFDFLISSFLEFSSLFGYTLILSFLSSWLIIVRFNFMKLLLFEITNHLTPETNKSIFSLGKTPEMEEKKII